MQRHVAIRRRDVDGIRFGQSAVLDVPHRHCRLASEQLGHHAAVGRREMLDDNVGKAELFRQIRQGLGKSWLRASRPPAEAPMPTMNGRSSSLFSWVSASAVTVGTAFGFLGVAVLFLIDSR